MTSKTDVAGHAEHVRRYYDHNAARFERYGQGGASIHRAVWAPGVKTRETAFHHVDELILRTLPAAVTRPTIVDFGCGVGASLIYLASRIDMIGEGITISPRQAERARTLIAAAGASDRVRCREGNFLSPPGDLHERADLTFSIEAFVHSPDPARYFQQAARTLRPGGTLVLCDDFLTPRGLQPTPRAARWLQDFIDGWRVGSLLTVEQIRELAAAHGLVLVRDLDLTPHLELRRPRDRLISLLLALGRPLRLSGEYWRSLVGGDALQHALIEGILNYRFLELQHRP